MLTPNTAAQRVAAFIANATPASFAAKVGGNAATPNQLGRAVTGYTGHSRMFSGVRQLPRNAGYRANPHWPAFTLPQWRALHGLQPLLAAKATAKQQGGARAKVGKLLGTAAKASGHAAPPRNVLPPLSSTRTQAAPAKVAAAAKGGAQQAASTQPASTPPVPAPQPAQGS